MRIAPSLMENSSQSKLSRLRDAMLKRKSVSRGVVKPSAPATGLTSITKPNPAPAPQMAGGARSVTYSEPTPGVAPKNPDDLVSITKAQGSTTNRLATALRKRKAAGY